MSLLETILTQEDRKRRMATVKTERFTYYAAWVEESETNEFVEPYTLIQQHRGSHMGTTDFTSITALLNHRLVLNHAGDKQVVRDLDWQEVSPREKKEAVPVPLTLDLVKEPLPWLPEQFQEAIEEAVQLLYPLVPTPRRGDESANHEIVNTYTVLWCAEELVKQDLQPRLAYDVCYILHRTHSVFSTIQMDQRIPFKLAQHLRDEIADQLKGK